LIEFPNVVGTETQSPEVVVAAYGLQYNSALRHQNFQQDLKVLNELIRFLKIRR
jgi:hypothetical protein